MLLYKFAYYTVKGLKNNNIKAKANNKSINTTMGFTPIDGVIMGTRCGRIDPSVVETIMNIENFPQTNTYEFYVWLSDDGNDQNYLMNKSFSGRIKINSASKKRNK